MSYKDSRMTFWFVRITGMVLVLLFMARLASAQSLDKEKVDDKKSEPTLDIQKSKVEKASGGSAFFAPEHPGNLPPEKKKQTPIAKPQEEEGKKEDEAKSDKPE